MPTMPASRIFATISSGENEKTVEAEYIFHSPEGKAYIPRNWYEREYKPFMRALVKAHPKIPLLTPHELRHTRATLWSAQGVPQHLIADLLGHCDTRMLERVYNHTTTDTLRLALEAVQTTEGESLNALSPSIFSKLSYFCRTKPAFIISSYWMFFCAALRQ